MITILGELYSKKNSKQMFLNRKTNKMFITSNDNVKKNEIDLVDQMIKLKHKWDKITQNKEYPFVIRFKFFRKTKRKFDYINILQIVADAMVSSGWLPDDDANHFMPVFEKWEQDKERPRCEIYFDN